MVFDLAVLLIAATALIPGTTQPSPVPPSAVSRDRAHISVYPPVHWDLRLYGRPDLSGSPAVHLTDDGLRVDGALVCVWPGGGWAVESSHNMVLGYRTRDAEDYRRCIPDGLPVLSMWGDNGKGAAALFIEVTARRGSIVESTWGARRLYFDLNSLPGDPQEPIPGAFLRRKGFLGWEWLPSERDQRRQIRAAYARRLREVEFSRFITDVRKCFSSTRAPDCLVPFVESPFADVEIAMAVGKTNEVTATELVRYVWTSARPDGDGRPIWYELRECLLNGEPEAIGRGYVHLQGDVHCTIERRADGWKLTSFYVGD